MTPQHVFELARHLTERDREIALRLYDVQVRWRKETFQGRHEPLVDEDTFSRARALVSERGEDFAARRANNPTSSCVLLLEDNATVAPNLEVLPPVPARCCLGGQRDARAESAFAALFGARELRFLLMRVRSMGRGGGVVPTVSPTGF